MANMTTEDYINKYGPELGPIKQKKAQRIVYARSLPGLIERFGEVEGTRLFEERRARERIKGTLQAYVIKYGEDEGRRRYEEKNKKLSVGRDALRRNGYSEDEINQIKNTHARKSARTLERDIEKYGPEEGTKRFEQWQASHRSRTNRCPEFWMERGLTKKEAKNLISQRQRDLSTREGFIARYGEHQGTKKYLDNNARKTRNLFGKNVSNLEHNFFKILSKKTAIDHHGFQQRVTVEGRSYVVDYKKGNKIIEVFGDFWHMSPEKFAADDCNVITKESAAARWEIDEQRIATLRSAGYEIVVIWEHEIYDDVDRAAETAITFLNEEIV